MTRATRNQLSNSVTLPAAAQGPQTVMARGRKICISECAFVFNRIWTATCTHQHDADEELDHHHKHTIKKHVMLTDLFHVIHLAGKLLNKSEPADDDETPFLQF